MKIYYVKFNALCEMFRETKEYFFTCFADNAKDAKEQCREYWPKLFNAPGARIPLQRNMYARQSSIQDVDLLGYRTWKGAPIRGRDCLGLICTDVTRWPR